MLKFRNATVDEELSNGNLHSEHIKLVNEILEHDVQRYETTDGDRIAFCCRSVLKIDQLSGIQLRGILAKSLTR